MGCMLEGSFCRVYKGLSAIMWNQSLWFGVDDGGARVWG